MTSPADLWLQHWLFCARCHHHSKWSVRSKYDQKCALGRDLQRAAVVYLQERWPQAFKDYQPPKRAPERKVRLDADGVFRERWE